MEKIVDYILVEAATPTVVTKFVLEKINEGWQPLGPAQYTCNNNGTTILQTLVMYK